MLALKRTSWLLSAALVAALLLLAVLSLPPARAHAPATLNHETHRHFSDAHNHYPRWVFVGTNGCSGGHKAFFEVQPHGNVESSVCHSHS